MGYQALLFCPDEKTARTVTQVLSELEFSVESCNEPFAAVKKLMAEHFDAIVVDCDNEQNATLLFKSARNSTSNQTLLAVAVVEGQAGVAKAFRIGANLVLTKPINVEQAKGTLRVARGLLRKGDPAKPATAAPTASAPAAPSPAAATPAKPRPTIPAPVTKPAAPAAPRPVQAATARTVSPAPTAKIPDPTEDVLEIDTDTDVPAVPTATPVAPPAFNTAPPQPFPKTLSPSAGVNPLLSPPTGIGAPAGATGAASAPAPARVAPEPAFEQPAPLSESAAAAKTVELGNAGGQVPDSSAPAPTFTFGGANTPESTDGGSKKALIGVAAAVVVAAGLYFGWTQFHGKSTSPSPVAQQPAPASTITPQSAQPSKPQPTLSSSKTSSATPVSSPSTQQVTLSNSPVEKPETDFTTDDSEDTSAQDVAPVKNSTKGGKAGSASAVKPPESKPALQPLMVKNGAVSPVQTKPAPAAEAPAPSVLGIAPASSGGGLPNLVANSNQPKPVLQTLNVSQGVSQGLLVKKVQPTYPPTALRMHVEGAVLLTATIGKTGSITAVKVLSGEPLLAQAALDAVKQWKYKPYFLNGEPVEIQTQVTVNFKLPR